MAVKKQSVRLMALLLALVMLYFALFIILRANHDCTGPDCPICRLIKLCVNLLRQLLFAVALLIAAMIGMASVRFPAGRMVGAHFRFTPVALKLKISI